MNLANLITLLRFPLLLLVVTLLCVGGPTVQLVGAGLIVLLILMDTLDGLVARRLKQTTLVGSMLDVAADRAVEIVLWVAFAYLKLLPLAIPVIVIVRGALTDSIRQVALQAGESPHSMMRGRIKHWLVASPPMRSGYGLLKLLTFTTLALAAGLRAADVAWWSAVWTAGVIGAWLATALCLARGLPVILDAGHLFHAARRGAAPRVRKVKRAHALRFRQRLTPGRAGSR